jgi:hypothetical protein
MIADSIPRARHWAGPLAGAVTLSIVSWQTGSLLELIGMGLGAVCLCWALVNFLYHAGLILADIRNEYRAWDFRMSENFKAEKIAGMNEGQLKAWMRGGRIRIGVQPGMNGPVEYVNEEPFFLYTVWYMLKNSTNRNICPINQFKQGTYHFDQWGDHEIDDYEQAKAITAYLVRYGWATWGLGNTSATWTNGNNPEKVMEFFGLKMDSYEPDVKELAG